MERRDGKGAEGGSIAGAAKQTKRQGGMSELFARVPENWCTTNNLTTMVVVRPYIYRKIAFIEISLTRNHKRMCNYIGICI